MKTTKWTNGLCALTIGASVIGTAMPVMASEAPVAAAEVTEQGGALNGTGEHKYDVRRGAFEQEGGSNVPVSRGRFEQPSSDKAEKTADSKISDKKELGDKKQDVKKDDKRAAERISDAKHTTDKTSEVKASESKLPETKAPETVSPEMKKPEAGTSGNTNHRIPKTKSSEQDKAQELPSLNPDLDN